MGRPDLNPCPRQCMVWPNALGEHVQLALDLGIDVGTDAFTLVNKTLANKHGE